MTSPDIYARWNSYHDTISHGHAPLRHAPTAHTGNKTIVVSAHPTYLLSDLIHGSLRKLFTEVSGLYQPGNGVDSIAKPYKQLETLKKAHRLCVSGLLQQFDEIYGTGTSKPLKYNLKQDTPQKEKIVEFTDLADLKSLIRKSHPKLYNQDEFKSHITNIKDINIETSLTLEAFKKNLSEQDMITLKKNDTTVSVENHCGQDVTTGYMAFIYQQAADNIINTLRIHAMY